MFSVSGMVFWGLVRFAFGYCVYFDQISHSSQRRSAPNTKHQTLNTDFQSSLLPSSAIRTILGENLATTSTSSCCAAITWWMFL